MKLIAPLFAAILFLAACGPAPTPTPTPIVVTPTPTPTPVPTDIKHVFVIVMENHAYEDIWGSQSAPYINSLGNQYGRASNFHALTHPSLPNYLQLFGGDNYTITTDCKPSDTCHVNAPHLGDSLEAKGLSWKAYMEGMPSPCYIQSTDRYVARHNPPVYFDNIRNDPLRCAAHDVPYTALGTDLLLAATTPNFALISPDLCNDMHDCSISIGDTWLKNNVPTILNSPACTADRCLVIVTWDEDDKSAGNHILTIFAGSGARTGGVVSDVSYTHYSTLRTVEAIFGLPTLTANDATAAPMDDLMLGGN